MDVLEAKRGPDLVINKHARNLDNKENKWREMIEYNIEDKGKIHALKWELYKK